MKHNKRNDKPPVKTNFRGQNRVKPEGNDGFVKPRTIAALGGVGAMIHYVITGDTTLLDWIKECLSALSSVPRP